MATTNKYIAYLEKVAFDLETSGSGGGNKSKLKMPSISPKKSPIKMDSDLSKPEKIQKSDYADTGADTKLDLKVPKIKPKT